MDDGSTVSAEHSNDEVSIRDRVERSERELDDLLDGLQKIDNEIEALAQQKHRYDLLSDVCRSLEELENIGAADLFWEAHSARDDQAARLRYAQDKIDKFCADFTDLEERRDFIVGKIGEQNHELDVLHYDLQDVIEREESRRTSGLSSAKPTSCRIGRKSCRGRAAEKKTSVFGSRSLPHWLLHSP